MKEQKERAVLGENIIQQIREVDPMELRKYGLFRSACVE